ncbi:hypothetical protein KR044_001655 [Drosophila immigrans]|nr:hypothetical protein KR044_001655 [Drosophila immigrans]
MYVFIHLLDPVAAKLPFLGSAWPTTILLSSYLIFVLKYGKIFMKDRQPFDLKNIIIKYNIFQVIYNFIMFCIIFYFLFLEPIYDFRCMPTIALDHPTKNIERTMCYVYFINKIIDLLDTIFFVLRKSYKQITLLHVFHHVIMVYILYWVVRFYGFGGQFVVMGFLNTFVHTIMYFYYMISAKYPDLKGSIWWKKYITITQIIQFLIIITQCVYIHFFNPDCEFPAFLQFMLFGISFSFVVMFTKFYVKSYIKPHSLKH